MSAAYQFPPIQQNGIVATRVSSARRRHRRDVKTLPGQNGRRSSTGDIKTFSKIQVRPRDQESSPSLRQKPHGQMVKDNTDESGNSFKYVIDIQLKEFEKKLIEDSRAAIADNSGPDAAGLKHNRPRKPIKVDMDRMSIVTNHIVVGNKKDATDLAGMKRLGITHVLNVAQQLPNSFPQSFIYHKIDLLDAPETRIVECYDEVASFFRRVEKLEGRVLVHCVSGVSRSVTVILMHLIGTHGIFLKHAYNHMKAIRPYIHPNEGFKLQLAQFEVECLGRSSVTRNAGEDWNFFQWNRIKYGYGRQPTVQDNVASACVIL